MTKITSYALQFTGFTEDSLRQTGADLLIVESGLTSAPRNPSLTAEQIDRLQDGGQRLIAYVNTSVTDAERAYWRDSWMTPDPAAGEDDVGTPTDSAPDWLRNGFGTLDFAPEAAGPAMAEATIVDFTDPAWRKMVVTQAVRQVAFGYDGVFLDDVDRYYEAGMASGTWNPEMANSMMQLVVEVAKAVRVINPDATVIVNSGVHIQADSSGDPQLARAYRAAIDGLLIEDGYQSDLARPGQGDLYDARKAFSEVLILGLETGLSAAAQEKFADYAIRHDILAYHAPSEAYDSFAASYKQGTTGNDRLTGEAGRDHVMAGGTGHDRLHGASGHDQLWGHGENDVILGRAGRDTLRGGAGHDQLSGGAGHDHLHGGTGRNVLSGGRGDDVIDSTTRGSSDTIILSLDNGRDTIRGFSAGEDHLDLRAFEVTLAEVRAATTDQGNTYLMLDLAKIGGSGAVLLEGVASLEILGANTVLV